MQALGEQSSFTERRADEATRDAVEWLKCEFMSDKLGKEFNGVISSVMSFGIFVALENVFVEGLVHITALKNDYYHYDPLKHTLRGRRTGATYRIGDRVRVQVIKVDVDEKQIDFEVV